MIKSTQFGFSGKEANVWYWIVPMVCSVFLLFVLPYSFALYLDESTILGLPLVFAVVWVAILLLLVKFLEWHKINRAKLLFSIPLWSVLITLIVFTSLFINLYLFNISYNKLSKAQLKIQEYQSITSFIGIDKHHNRSLKKILNDDNICKDLTNKYDVIEEWSGKYDLYKYKIDEIRNPFRPAGLLESLNASIYQEKSSLKSLLKPCKLENVSNFGINDLEAIKNLPVVSLTDACCKNAGIFFAVLILVILFYLPPLIGATTFIQTLK